MKPWRQLRELYQSGPYEIYQLDSQFSLSHLGKYMATFGDLESAKGAASSHYHHTTTATAR